MIVRTEAVVLRSIEYGETSRIVTLYTRARGKVAVLARGARSRSSRFGSSLQPLSYIQAVYYDRPGRDLQTLSETSHVRPFVGIWNDVHRTGTGLRVVELAQAVVQEDERNPGLFDLLVQVLTRLNEGGEPACWLWPYFQLRLAHVLGFAPSFEREAVRTLAAEGGVLLLESGSIAPQGTPQSRSRHASRSALRSFAICARANLDAVLALPPDEAVLAEVDGLIEAYLQEHLGACPTRAARVMSQIVAPATPHDA
jgi:DNA repair protein RecO (recombination protein O)